MRTIPEVARDPHLWEREMLVKKDDAVAGEVLGRLLDYDRATLDAIRPSGTIA